MDLHQRTLRIGLTAILFALILRFSLMDIPSLFQALAVRYIENTASETGQNVRFSPSLEVFLPKFVETPPPFVPEPDVPAFSGKEDVDLFYASGVEPEIETLLVSPLEWNLQDGEPRVLILHTHTTESYTKGATDYVETASYRTLDESYNMLSIGAETAKLLSQQGIQVIHDTEIHDYPSYNGSYSDARKTMDANLEKYPGIQLVLDLHRDASEGTYGQLRTSVQVDGIASAQLMVVIGTNHKNYEQNLSLGLKLHAQLERQAPGITRPLQLRAQRFNQDLCPGALLIEVGAAGNTHEEALAAARQLAQAVIALAGGSRTAEETVTE